MKAKRAAAVVAGVAIAGGVIAVVMMRKHSHPVHHRADTTKVHATGIDDSDSSASMAAMLSAPEGGTPCETAFAAIEAEQAAAKLRGAPSIFQWVAPKADFLTRCQALTLAQQQCMMPRFRRDHRADCANARPPEDVLKQLVVGVPVPEPHVP